MRVLPDRRAALAAALLLGAFSLLPAPLPTAGAYEASLNTQDLEGALEDTKLNEVFSQYLATIQMYDPERATRMGLHDADDKLTQRTPERVASELKAFQVLRKKLDGIKKSDMAPSLQVDYDLLDHMLEVDIYEMTNLNVLARRPQYYLEPLFLVYEMMNKEYADYNTRAAAAISRLDQLPAVLLQAERNISKPPKIWTQQAIRQADDALNNISDFVPLFRGYTSYDPTLKTRVDATLDNVKTALARYSEFLRKDVLPGPDSDFRCGEYTYGFYLERRHGLDMTPGSAYSYSKKAFKRSLKALEKEAVNIDALTAKKKGWQGVMDQLPTEHPDERDVLKTFQDEVDRAYQHFDQYKVVEFPRQRLLIKKMPRFMSSALPYVYYAPPFALDDNRVSELYVLLPSDSLSDAARDRVLASGFNYALIELLTAYSVMPGQHLRSYESSLNHSRIRRISRQPIIDNGWACYAEYLAEEMGFYSSYWSRFLRAYVQLLRSARAYADTALHTKRWTADQASAFFQDKLGMSKAQADGEVLKISLNPTEGFSYIYGMDRILELRHYYERTEARYFDLRRFHTDFLKMGDIPIDSIESEMRRITKEEDRIVR